MSVNKKPENGVAIGLSTPSCRWEGLEEEGKVGGGEVAISAWSTIRQRRYP